MKSKAPRLSDTEYQLINFEPWLAIRSQCIIYFNKIQCRSSNSGGGLPLFNKNNGLVSDKQAKKIRYYVNLLVDASKWKTVYSRIHSKHFRFKLSLLTLTLPSIQQHPDKEIHEKVFKAFIRSLKKRNPELLYIYKAEVQDNGNLHYHLTTNIFIHHVTLRNLWNHYVNSLGYVNRASVSSPNSTDVHSVKNIKSIAAYMVAYLQKKDVYTKILKRYHRRFGSRLKSMNSEVFALPKNYIANLKRKVTIKVWDCSKTLMLKPLSVPLGSSVFTGYFDSGDNDITREYQAIISILPKLNEGRYFGVYGIGSEERKSCPAINKAYQGHLQVLRDHTKAQDSIYYID